MRQRMAQRPLTVILLIIIFLLVLALVWVFYQQRNAGEAAPIGRVTPTTLATRQAIVIESPQANASVGSPFEVRGRTAFFPFEGSLVYRVFDAGGALIGTGPFQAQGEYGRPATFTTPISYTLAAEGPGRVEVVEFSAADGSVLAASSVSLTLQASGTLLPPTANQEIVIETPPPGTQVGSPVVITGRTARLPANGQLAYQITSGNLLLGAGVFGVAASGAGATFNESFSFNLPVQGGLVRVDIVERNPLDQSVVAIAGIDVTVAPQQQGISIETPPVGTTIGSPVVITGRTQQFPLQGSLAYRVVDAFGQQLGADRFPVQGSPGQPATFNASLVFVLPPQGGPVRVEIFDQDANTGAVLSTASVDLFVAPQPVVTPPPPPATLVPPPVTPLPPPTTPAPPPATLVPSPPATPAPSPAPQQIVIETPPQGTTVGSPVVITGRTTYVPNQNTLNYRIVDDRNSELGTGIIPVTGSAPNGATFNASLTFNEPPAGGLIRVEIFDTNEADGNVITRATINLLVAPRPVATETVVPLPQPITPLPYPAPAPSPRTVGAQNDGQQIVIDAPTTGQTADNPLMVYGRVAQQPTGGELAYRVIDASGAALASGRFPISAASSAPISFVATVTFASAAPPGTLLLEVFEPDGAGGALARAAVQIRAE